MASNTKQYRVNRLKRHELVKYFKEHVTKHEPYRSYLFKVHTELKVFKKILTADGPAIASMIIPVGAEIHATCDQWGRLDGRKMRASKAKVVRIFKTRTHTDATSGYSGWTNNFRYKTKRIVQPSHPFYRSYGHCESGIHFFLQVNDALDWNV